MAQGTGTLTWTVSEGIQTETGRLEGGKYNGRWVLRFASGNVAEGPFVNGEQTATGPSVPRTGASRKGPWSTVPGTATGFSATWTETFSPAVAM